MSNTSKTSNDKALYEVWKEGEYVWRFKTPTGIETRCSQRAAEEDAENWRKANTPGTRAN